MTEIKGYLLTEEEEKACINLIKQMRGKEKLVNAFRKAFNALQEAEYDVFIEGTCIANFDEFEIC